MKNYNFRKTKSKVIEVTLTGGWDQITLPSFYTRIEFENTTTGTVSVKLNSDTATRDYAVGEIFSLAALSAEIPHCDSISVSGTAAQTIKVEYESELI